jgi:hypothetical protein
MIYPLFLLVALSSLFWAPNDLPAQDLRPEEIVTILPKDAIPAILTSFPSAKAGTQLNETLGCTP